MIRSLIIGKQPELEWYSNLLSNSKYFGDVQLFEITHGDIVNADLPVQQHDAILLVSQIEKPFQLFELLIKSKTKFYFVDQPTLTLPELTQLDHLFFESGNLIFPEIIELQHTLVKEFISTTSRHLLFRYNKSILSKKEIRLALLNALSFLSLLSPMQVKKVDINTIGNPENERPVIKIRLKMYDSSVAYLMLKFENREEHSILIETKIGSFSFNLTEGFMENVNGVKFKSEKITTKELVLEALNSFALHIIFNNAPTFTFHHYCLAMAPLTKIETILQNSF